MEANRFDRVRALVALGGLEFFGPALRDIGPSHAQNPTWVGHARLHMVWTIVLFVGLGALDMYLAFAGRGTPAEQRNLRLALALQLANLVAFWTAWASAPLYGGAIVIDAHTQILGVNENTFVFCVLAAVFAIASALFVRAGRTADARELGVAR